VLLRESEALEALEAFVAGSPADDGLFFASVMPKPS
jgi:hypothetical protein